MRTKNLSDDVFTARSKIHKRTELALKRIMACSEKFRKLTQDRTNFEKFHAQVLIDQRI